MKPQIAANWMYPEHVYCKQMVILDESSKDDRTELSYGDMGVDHLVTTPFLWSR